MVHIYNRILLGHEKEHTWISSAKVDEPRAYYTELRKSEREKQISYISADMDTVAALQIGSSVPRV